ncbi:MAG: hypothetical protein ACO1N0_17735 [Fluviicola sp.]
MIVIDSARFVVISKDFAATKEITVLKRYENMKLISKRRLAIDYNGRSIYYKQFELVNDTVNAYFSVSNSETFDYYVQQLDEMGSTIGNPSQICSFPRLSNKTWNSGGLIFTPDRQHFLIYLVVTDNKADIRSFQFAYFSKNGKLVRSHEISGTKRAQDTNFKNIWITNQGKIIVSETVHYQKTIGERKSNRRMEALCLHVAYSDTSHTLALMAPEDQYLTHLTLSINTHTLQGQGIYCSDQDHFAGLFTFFASDTSSSEVNVRLSPRLNYPELASFDLRFSNKDKKPEKTKDYVCNDMKFLGNFIHVDSTLFVWERVATIDHQNGESYQSRDLLLAEMFNDSLLHCKVIPKSTNSMLDHAKNISSYVEQKSPNELRFFFNDYADLYSPARTYLEHSRLLKHNRIFPAPFAVVEVVYNLQERSFSRRLLFDKTEFEVEAMPLFWTYVGKQKMLLQFASFRKYRFAYWNL